MRLQSRDLAKQKQNPSPFGPLPGHVRLDKKKIGQHRAKPAQRGDEPELSDFFAEIEVCDVGKLKLSMLQRHRALGRKFHHAKDENYWSDNYDPSWNYKPSHNSVQPRMDTNEHEFIKKLFR